MPAAAQLPHRRSLRSVVIVSMLVALFVALFVALTPRTAGAEEIFTRQAAAAHATDSAWIAAPERRAAVCIIDTGAGTEADNSPDLANVLARFAVDTGPPVDLNRDHHGTLMAMIASAPYNGFGMVGAAPNVNVVSVRASRDGATFGSADLTAAIQLCQNKRATYNIKVVSLSLGGAVNAGLDQVSIAATEDAVDNARRAGLSVVAAAGNHPGDVDWPAGYAPVLAVGAADDQGTACGFAASGPELDLWAPGCPIDVAVPDGRAAWATGSSESTAIVAAVLAQLRSLRPDLSADDAERILTVYARTVPAGPFLDVDASYRAAGLVALLRQGHNAVPQPIAPVPSSQNDTETRTPAVSLALPSVAPADVSPQAPPTVAPKTISGATPGGSRLPTPIVRTSQLRSGRLTIRLKNRPAGARVRIDIYTRRRGRAFPARTRRTAIPGTTLRHRVSGTLTQVTITYRDPSGAKADSATLTLHPRTSK